MTQKRKIAIYTGNRAEYGLQFPIIKAIKEHPDLEYYLLVSGAHLQEDFGYTKGEIEKDGFEVAAEVKLDMKDDTVLSTARAIGSGILSLSEVLAKIEPDIHVVYADRFEGFSAMITSTQMNIPTAHIEGGDLTEGGALDDSVRHAMTKLAHLHFTTNEQAKERVLKLGEESWRVFNTGFPALDLIKEGDYAQESEIKEKLPGIDTDQPVILFTQHSVTTEFEKATEQVIPAIKALKRLAQEGCQVIMTYPNNDAGGKRIIHELEKVAQENLENIFVRKSLGRYLYHGVLNLCGEKRGVCLGNSSSGIKETPVFACPVVNIGSRQEGRLRALNVIDAAYDEEEIYLASKKAIEDESFRELSRTCENPYGTGNSGPRIAKVLSEIELGQKILRKKMTY